MLLKTFGGLTIAFNEGEPTGAAAQRRRLALLALLAAAGDRGLTREKLIGFLWPESDEERARAALAQALYALRRDLGAENAIEGSTTIKLNETVLPSDVGLFRKAMADGKYSEAAELYAGPFLDGVHLPEAEEFARFVDEERARLAREAADACERAAAAATKSGDHARAAAWWRKRVTLDPLEARATLGLMESLAAAGDRAAALQHARVYETLLSDQLGVAPDAAVSALSEQLRRKGGKPVGRTEDTRPVESNAGNVTPDLPPSRLTALPPSHPPALAPNRLLLAALGLALIATIALVVRNQRDPTPPAASTGPVLAVGSFRAYGAGARDMSAPLTDMLATNLARETSLTVLSAARLYELAGGVASGDTSTALMRAARAGGATTLLDGAIYAQGDSVRLDLRRTDLASGTVAQALSVRARDVFTAVDLATAELLRSAGASAPAQSIASVTTGSLLAYRLYVEGLNAMYASRTQAAYRLFTQAAQEDTAFAMAEHHAAMTAPTDIERKSRAQRAVRLSERASERERLRIRWHWASAHDDPAVTALAESLVSRFDAEPFAHLAAGRSLVTVGRFADALPHYRKAIERERFRGPDITPGACLACEAQFGQKEAYQMLDSGAAALRVLRQWGNRGPHPELAAGSLADALMHIGTADEALRAVDRAVELGAVGIDAPLFRVWVAMRHGDFAAADPILRDRLRGSTAPVRGEALWYLTFSYRNQGRIRDAIETARAVRANDTNYGQRGAAPYAALLLAAVYYEGGRYREAAALFDSIALLRPPQDPPTRHARHQIWMLSLGSTARAAAGDTAGLLARADSIEMLSRMSAYGRDHRLHHHVRGLVYAARGAHAEAAESFRRAIYSPVVGYTRSNIALATELLALGRPAEAIAPLRAVLHGPIDGPNAHLPLVEAHERLAEVFAAAGMADSAAAHARFVAAAWAGADPEFRERRARMQRLSLGTGER